MKPNPFKNAAMAMSRAVADDAILTRLGERKGAKHAAPEPDKDDPKHEAAEEAAPPVPAAHGDGESPDTGLSAVARLEQSFTPKRKRSVEVGSAGRGEVGPKHSRNLNRK